MKILILALLFMCPLLGIAQQAIAVSGKQAKGSGGTSSHTYGQVFYRTAYGNGMSSAQGVQHTYEVSVVFTDPKTDSAIQLYYYPNPVVDYLNVIIQATELDGLVYEVFDSSGRLLKTDKLLSNDTPVYVGDLSIAVYYIKIRNRTRILKTFNIIKK
ncbi:T9SS type A sorting domain-containing protein [uncultured Maribacter sp.]|uniref:T9SS type A sorting domain-containing protein n=1 Tax=uncultured Maribacter sp. TaxID=431308 RepID=UPI0030D6ECD0